MNDIRRLLALPLDLSALAATARREGFRMLDVLAAEWADGTTRFTEAGEALFGGFDAGGALLAIGGITRDPFAAALRMRRFYVAPQARRSGLGAKLARMAIAEAETSGAGLIRLRAPAAAFAFWQSLGFLQVAGDSRVTHALALEPACRPL